MRLLLLSFVAVSTAAFAQSTNCRWTAGGWACETDKPLDYGAIMQSGRSMVPTYQAPQEDRSLRLRRAVGNLLRAGKCDEAEALALKQGDIELAGQVRSYCAK